MLKLVRYIHLNPLRAGQVNSLEELKVFPYCGHGRLLATTKDDWQTIETVLERFGKRVFSARKGYEAFVADRVSQGQRPDLIGGGLIRSSGGWRRVKQNRQAELESKSDERILGEGQFVEEVLREAEEELARRTGYEYQGIGFDELLKQAARQFAQEADDLLRPGKQPARVNGRSLLCFWAVRDLGMTASEVGRRIGLTQSAVSRAVQRGEKLSVEMKITFLAGNA